MTHGLVGWNTIFLHLPPIWMAGVSRPPLWNKGFGCAPLGRRSTPCPRPTAGGWVGILRDLRVVSQCFTHVFLFLNSLRKDADKWKPVVFGDAVCFPHILCQVSHYFWHLFGGCCIFRAGNSMTTGINHIIYPYPTSWIYRELKPPTGTTEWIGI